MRKTLSVILITKNEEDRVARCLQSVQDLADEIIVLDSGSTDNTVKICSQYTDNIEITDWPGFGKQKQRALDKASCDWVLSIDADEELDEEMRSEINRLLESTDDRHVAYRLPWGVTIHGKTLKHGRSARSVLRLAVNKGSKYTLDEVHETIVPPNGSIGVMKGLLLHYTHRDFGHALQKSSSYAWLGSQKYFRKNKKSYGLFLALLRAIWTFIHIYIFRLGFLDGSIGFIVAMTYAQGKFNKYAGLWLLQQKEKRERKKE
ncbi:glycosyltransferase family 2 protein [Psychromonas antarctica]|jgi:glycosyltransferase involved in cell wall biosynthesis|uniref:glycosyltransferase family 2 protein n=1 Tax=Psychromonas antarctica TaxID=67573 RepID=UPI001EE93E02|nr:glycosyltransferase family 2 protein [Psychromonas antarctica]MCG6201410.1 glycosyltransferase family 2 protein [Psychromonas antarctica]